MMGLLNGMSAQNRPTAMSPTIESEEVNLSGEFVAEFTDLGLELIVPSDGTLDDPAVRAKAERLAFDAMIVKIKIHEGAEDQADQVVPVWVNGRPFHMQRGGTYDVPRYVVELLASARPMTYRNVMHTDGQGIKSFKYPMSQGTRYPFSIIQDSYKDSARWLAAIESRRD
jgi:hypothetical protein